MLLFDLPHRQLRVEKMPPALVPAPAPSAVHGMGVALAPPFFVQEELAQGRLVNIAPRPVSGQRAYSLIYPEHKAELPALQAFSAWLQAEAAA